MYLVWLDGIKLDAMRFKGTTNKVTWTGKLDREVLDAAEDEGTGWSRVFCY